MKEHPISDNLTFYHGTRSGDAIRAEGFLISCSGFGQRGLCGVALTLDECEAARYAGEGSLAPAERRAERPEILRVVARRTLRLADLRGMDSAADIWKALGFDWETEEGAAAIRARVFGAAQFPVVTELRMRGFEGAIIDNTCRADGQPEYVIFDPAALALLG